MIYNLKDLLKFIYIYIYIYIYIHIHTHTSTHERHTLKISGKEPNAINVITK